MAIVLYALIDDPDWLVFDADLIVETFVAGTSFGDYTPVGLLHGFELASHLEGFGLCARAPSGKSYTAQQIMCGDADGEPGTELYRVSVPGGMDVAKAAARIADALEKLVTKIEAVDRVQIVFDNPKPLKQLGA